MANTYVKIERFEIHVIACVYIYFLLTDGFVLLRTRNRNAMDAMQ